VQAVLGLALAAGAASAGCASLALVTPYRAHARLLAAGAASLGGVATAATVHRFQGSERDVVILDLVDAAPAEGASQLTGGDRDTALRLLNVAISRARGKLLVVTDAGFIHRKHARSSPARHLLRLLGRDGRLERPGVPFLKALASPSWLTWFDGWTEAGPALIGDLNGAGRRLVMNLPAGVSPSAEMVAAVRAATFPGDLRHAVRAG
jgi:hypothetical protein